MLANTLKRGLLVVPYLDSHCRINLRYHFYLLKNILPHFPPYYPTNPFFLIQLGHNKFVPTGQ